MADHYADAVQGLELANQPAEDLSERAERYYLTAALVHTGLAIVDELRAVREADADVHAAIDALTGDMPDDERVEQALAALRGERS